MRVSAPSIPAFMMVLALIGCDSMVWPDDYGDVVYLAAGRSREGPIVEMLRAGRRTPLAVARGEPDTRNMALVRIPTSGDLVWIYGGGNPGRTRIEWAAVRLEPDVRRQFVLRDTDVLGSAALVIPADAWPGTATADGFFVALAAAGEPGGLLILNASDLTYHGFVTGFFLGTGVTPGPEPSSLLALGMGSRSDTTWLYVIDASSASAVDSMKVPAASRLVPGPTATRVFVGGGGPVYLYDLQQRTVVAETWLPFGGPLAFSPARQCLFAGDAGSFDFGGSARVIAVDASLVGITWEARVGTLSGPQSIISVYVTDAGTTLFAVSAPPPFCIGCNSSLSVWDIDLRRMLYAQDVAGWGHMIGP